jgi:hypothetical protein
MFSEIVFADEHLEGVENAKKNSRLVHVIYVLREDGWISQFTANDGKPVSGLLFGLPIISLPIDRS